MKAMLKSLGVATWVITGICSLHVGLQALGYDVMGMVPGLAGLSMYVSYVFGVAGLLSLVMFVMHCCGEHMCNCANCKCN